MTLGVGITTLLAVIWYAAVAHWTLHQVEDTLTETRLSNERAQRAWVIPRKVTTILIGQPEPLAPAEIRKPSFPGGRQKPLHFPILHQPSRLSIELKVLS